MLTRKLARRPAPSGDSAPHLARGAALMGLLVALAAPSTTRAESPAAAALATSADLDGVYLTLGPVGAAVHQDGDWDASFGGELSLVRVTERAPVAAAGVLFGGGRFARRDGGRLWVEALAGTRRLADLPLGLSGGPVVDLDDGRGPRWGGQATLWAYLGIMPYARVSTLQRLGTSVEVGLRLPLPALRW
jgi:hypothetical protein